MATTKQRQAAKRNVKKAQSAARKKRTGAKTPKTRQELYREAQRRNLPGRSKMRRDELARALGQR
jgi:hypothetical protein